MKIEKLELLHLKLPLAGTFETSFGRMNEKQTIIIRAKGGGKIGYGEAPAGSAPAYSHETAKTVRHVVREFLAPKLKDREFSGPGPIADLFSSVRGHPMAKAALEMAVNDLLAKIKGEPLWKILGGTRAEIPVGITLGLEEKIADTLRGIEEALKKGYQRIKLRIRPGKDIDVVRDVRRSFPSIRLMVDAGAAYQLSDADYLRKLDEYNLTLIEQPLDPDDIVDHAVLAKKLQTPICLDESIKKYDDARRALDIGACRIINIKQARVGGQFAAKMVHNIAKSRNTPVFCGGLLESGIGRAHNIALASLPNFTMPADIPASTRYFREDIVDPPISVSTEGTIRVPEGAGIGFKVDEEKLTRFAHRREFLL